MENVEYPIINDCFEHDGKNYDCGFAIERDIKMILQEAEISHGDSFDKIYDKNSLKADRVRIFLDNEGKPVFGMVIYFIEYKDEDWKRCACGGYYPFWENALCPHPFQESICW